MDGRRTRLHRGSKQLLSHYYAKASAPSHHYLATLHGSMYARTALNPNELPCAHCIFCRILLNDHSSLGGRALAAKMRAELARATALPEAPTELCNSPSRVKLTFARSLISQVCV